MNINWANKVNCGPGLWIIFEIVNTIYASIIVLILLLSLKTDMPHFN